MPTSASSTANEAETRAFHAKFARARSLILANNTTAARAVNDELLAERPDHGGALLQRSRLESIEDHYRLARDYALAAWRAGGVEKKQQCLLLLGQLKTYNLADELRDLISRLPPELALDPEVARLVAQLFTSFNDPDAALAFANRAAERNPDSALLRVNTGLALLNLGRFDEAEQHLLECLRLDPCQPAAWWHLSRLRKQSAGSNHVDALRREIERASEPLHVATLAYALHRELDDLGDYAEAARALELANTRMRKVVAYSAEEDERLFDALKALPACDGREGADVADAPFTPVFIVGMHRSGTTLLEHLLSGHDDVASKGELYDFTSQLRYAADHHCRTELDLRIVQAAGDFDYAAIGRGYLDSVGRRHAGQRFVTDKLPSNFLNIGFILRALPNAKILHMSREPMETCFSNLREPFSTTTCRYSYDQDELARYYRLYFDLMQHWRQRFPGRIFDVTYTSLATDTAAELKRVTNYLGTTFQPTMVEGGTTRSVTTASAVQVRQKPGLPEQPKWLPYREYLTPMNWRLSDVGQRH